MRSTRSHIRDERNGHYFFVTGKYDFEGSNARREDSARFAS